MLQRLPVAARLTPDNHGETMAFGKKFDTEPDTAATVATGDAHLPETWQPHTDYTQLTFDQLLEQAGADGTLDAVKGSDLTDKDQLVGVPLIITAVTFRRGIVGADGTVRDYVSIEAKTQDGDIVFNDGSTGIRRQIVAYLVKKGAIDLGDVASNSDYDKSMYQWQTPEIRLELEDVKHVTFRALPDGTPIALMAKRGLRVSSYDWNGKDTETWYLA
jgi:hypothetical protein